MRQERIFKEPNRRRPRTTEELEQLTIATTVDTTLVDPLLATIDELLVIA